MKSLHRLDLFGWSVFDEARDLDFNGTLWVHAPRGNVAFDPMPVSDHDARHIDNEGGVAWVYVTNADHVRAAAEFRERFGARIAAPELERGLPQLLDLQVDRWLQPNERLDNGIRCMHLAGSKTPGELCFVLPGNDTAIVGDLVRGPRAGALDLLPAAKLSDPDAAARSVHELATVPGLDALIVGDGQSVFHDARRLLANLLARLQPGQGVG